MVKRRSKNSRKGRISKQKRSLFLFASVLILLTFAIIIQGCTPTPEPEPVRNLSTALEVFEPPAFKCIDEDDSMICRTTSPDNLSLIIVVPKQEDHKSVTVIEVPLSNKEEVLKAKSDFKITRLVANFEVRDAESDEIITVFNPPLTLRLEYSADQWKDYKTESGSDRPRLAYLVWKDGSWATSWQEFTTDDIFEVIQPGADEKYPDRGFLIIHIKEWGDPLIGGT